MGLPHGCRALCRRRQPVQASAQAWESVRGQHDPLQERSAVARPGSRSQTQASEAERQGASGEAVEHATKTY